MHSYWKDLENPDGTWSGLAIQLSSGTPVKPVMRLQTGADGRIKLINSDHPVFWATMTRYYSGVWLIKSFYETTLEEMPIPPIRSSDIESRKVLTGDNKLKAWSRYFIQQLTTSKASFLYPGLWMCSAFVCDSTSGEWCYHSVDTIQNHDCRAIYQVKQALREDQPEWIDWGINGSYDLISLKQPDQHDGRLKWWRKKAKENSLPPILIWYLRCLDSYIIIDGHYRLQAAYLENTPPELMVLYSAEEINVTQDESAQRSIIQSLSQTSTSKRRKPISVDRMNDILIQAFNTNPVIHANTQGWAEIREDTLWVDEVSQILKYHNKSHLLEKIITREGL